MTRAAPPNPALAGKNTPSPPFNKGGWGSDEDIVLAVAQLGGFAKAGGQPIQIIEKIFPVK
jgi:hypothetical protein